MVKIYYCDKCEKQIAGYDNEYGQVTAVTIITSGEGSNGSDISDGEAEFCSVKCAIEYLKKLQLKENDAIDRWRRGKILGVAPVKSKKINRRE